MLPLTVAFASSTVLAAKSPPSAARPPPRDVAALSETALRVTVIVPLSWKSPPPVSALLPLMPVLRMVTASPSW